LAIILAPLEDEVSTESGSDRMRLLATLNTQANNDPVATALGTDLITQLTDCFD